MSTTTPLTAAGSRVPVAVAVLRRLASFQVDTQRGAKQRRLDIVGDDRIAAEDHLHVATADQRGDMLARGGMDDGRAEHEEDAAAVAARLAHGLGNGANSERLGALRRDGALHEGESLAPAGAPPRLRAHPPRRPP